MALQHAEGADTQRDDAQAPRPWAKPTMRALVAGWFGTRAPDGNPRGGYFEGCQGLLTYPPTTNCYYQNPPS